ncbi:MAG: CocE/NonD family hydrolase [Microcoleaceae cyanobacterium]
MVIQTTASMLTRDGLRLDADIYRPEQAGDFPVLLMRQPYGRKIASTVVYALPSWYAAQGYVVVIQDVRGRGSSEGEFDLFKTEVEDGIDTIQWAANLPGSTGQVGMYGFSYQGMTQLYAASQVPPELKTLCPAMIGYDLYNDWAYEGGAFCLQANLAWAIQLAAETVRRSGDTGAYQALYQASRNLPLYEGLPADPGVLQTLAPESFYHDWLRHFQPDEYWQALNPQMSQVDLPMLHIGGWFDAYLRGTLQFYQDRTKCAQAPQYLVIGPWAHLPWGRRVGAMNYGIAADNRIDELQIRWFDQFLKGIDTGLLEEPAVSLFEMGSNQWREFDTWPDETVQSYLLFSTGLAGIQEAAGTLLEIVEAENLEDENLEDENLEDENLETKALITYDTFVHDPWRPVPSLGGHAGFPSGSVERSALDCRSDILTYTSAPLEKSIHFAGSGIVEVYCEVEAMSYDLCAVVSDVHPDGKVYNFTQGYRRVYPPETSEKIQLETGTAELSNLQIQKTVIQLQATCIQIPPGHSIRLSLSGAYFPSYSVNPGTGQFYPGNWMDAKVITVRIYSGETYPSQVSLPITL